MKKIILTILLIATPALAFEDYMIISNTPVKSVSVQNEKILTAKPVFTIDNEKKIILITPLNEGKTKIDIKLSDNDKETLHVKIEKENTIIKENKNFNYYSVDMPPKGFLIPLPPANRILPKPPIYKGGK